MANNCKKCNQADDDNMVQCDTCDRWFHFNCVGVDSYIADISWNCEACGHSESEKLARPVSSSSPTNGVGGTQGERRVHFTTDVPTAPATNIATAKAHATAPEQITQCLPGPISATQSISTLSQSVRSTTASATLTNFVSLSTPENPPSSSRGIIQSKDDAYSKGDVNSMLNETRSQNLNSSSQRSLQLARLEEEFKIQQQYLAIKYKILSQSSEHAFPSTFSMPGVGPTATQLAARQAIPKQLPTFIGDPEEWPLFISTFENSTAVAGFSDAENLIRLQACLKGKARDIVKNKLFLPSMVADIIQTLKICFGRPEQILERAMNQARAMPPLKDKLESLINFALFVNNICTTMEGCKMYPHLHNPLLVKELVDKLPNHHKLNWAMYPKDESIPTVKLFSEWLYKLAEVASTIVSFAPNTGSSVVNTHTIEEEVHIVERTASKNKLCSCCKSSGHSILQCGVFKSLPLSRRWDTVNSNGLCRKCLGTHKRRCLVGKVCGIDGCTIRHHKLLHKTTATVSVEQPTSKFNKPEHSNAQVNNHSNSSVRKQPLFRIVPVVIHAGDKMLKVFAFLDEGSAVTLMEKSIFDKLGLKGIHEPICLRWTGNTTRIESDSMRATIPISNSSNGRTYKLNGVHTVNALDLPAQSIDAEIIAKNYPYLNGLPIESYNNVKASLLIGADNWKLAVPLKIKEGTWSQPIASKTRLGWTVQGGHRDHSSEFRLKIHSCHCQKGYVELHEAVKEFFRLESPKSTKLLSAEDQMAVDLMNATFRKFEGFYEIGLLWRNPNVSLPDSYSNALNRSICLERKCARDPNLKTVIQMQIDNLVSKGYAEKLTMSKAQVAREKVWYLPILVVTNPNNPGKVRLVWDAAAKANGVSLNDFLLSGPDMLNSLFEVLLAFRVGKVAICGDIAEMFHRIRVKESDRHAQRFLWWDNDDKSQQPSIYVMRALTFGTSCAPCIAHFVRDKNASCFKDEFPRAVEAIQKHHYFDDFIDSEDDEQAALQLALRVKQIHASAGFNIHGWTSNSQFVLKHLQEDWATGQGLKEWGSEKKILGMFWDPANDTFRYICRFMRLRRDVVNDTIVPTKRETLQVLMSIFDPLGLISCFTIGLKILIQDIWRSNIGWDEPLNTDLYEKWCRWKSNIHLIKAAKIPRCYSQFLNQAKEVQLHTFVEAGENAFAAVCYLRVEHTNGASITLVAAKSKVSPPKPLSIPRLELQAALIGVRLASAVLNVQRIQITNQYWWTDSKTVLRWLRIDPKNFKPYVMHRVGEILESTNVSQWKWVPSKENPADLATKTAMHLNYAMWFSGPDFLRSQSGAWPHCEEFQADEADQIELKLLQIENVHHKSLSLNAEYFSNWRRLYRAVATFLLYMDKLLATIKMKKMISFIDFEMIRRAKLILIRYAQASVYSEEISLLKLGKAPRKLSQLSSLNVYLDEDNVIKSKRRAEHLNNRADVIVLPNSHHITLLIVRSIHETFHHNMHEAIINTIRAQYYIPRLRVLYRKVRKSCQKCKNDRTKLNTPQIVALPAARLAAFEKPFTFVGIDFFGPLFVTVGRRREKRWAVLFTCLTFRAVHIEVVHSLDTSSCVMSIRNFIARRGYPREIFTDNGTNFKATKKIIGTEVKGMDFSLLESTLDQIKWRFNPPAAPHIGGAWERLVRSVKSVLHEIMPSANFNDETLKSSLYEVEYIINARPLTFVSLESDDDDALTPNHLLIGSTDGYKPICTSDVDLRQCWHQSQKFADRFWHRWVKEYVPIISRRSKWFDKLPPIRVGNIVVIVDENLPRNCWPKGVVINTVLARDGQVRSVVVKTSSGILHRATAKIAVLDVASSERKLVTDSFTGEGMLPPISGAE